MPLDLQTIKIKKISNINLFNLFNNLDTNELLNTINQYGFDNIRDTYGNTLLHLACNFGYEKIVDFFIEMGVDINIISQRINTPLLYACEKEYFSIIEKLLSNGANPYVRNSSGKTAFHLSLNKKIIQLFINFGIDINFQDNSGNNLLHQACESNNLDIVNFLISQHVNINIHNNGGDTPLYLASENNNVVIVKLLINNKADIFAKDQFKKIPFHVTANPQIIQLFLDLGVDINFKNYESNTPLHFACINNSFDAAKTLLQYHVDINKKNNHSQTPLHYVCQYGSIEIAELLISHGAHLNLKNKNGNTPLHDACQRNYMNIVQLLVCHLADLNIQDNDGNTAFHLACQLGRFDAVQLLISANVNLNIENNEKLTALDLAMINNHLPIVSMINAYQSYSDLNKNILNTNSYQIIKKNKL